jgi:hypothetical protein
VARQWPRQPSEHLAGGRVQHRNQVQLALIGGNFGAVPEQLAVDLRRRVALDQVRRLPAALAWPGAPLRRRLCLAAARGSRTSASTVFSLLYRSKMSSGVWPAGSWIRLRGPVVLVDHAAGQLPAPHRRIERHDGWLVTAGGCWYLDWCGRCPLLCLAQARSTARRWAWL